MPAARISLFSPWLLTLTLTSPAHATWTIVAVDQDTGAVGAAGATCSPLVSWVLATAPGHGVVVAQGATSLEARDRIAAALADGQTAQQALKGELRHDDDERAFRQYGVISWADGESVTATFTGDGLDDVKGSMVGNTFSVQGNILASEAVLSDAAAAFDQATAQQAPLAERLLQALEAGARQGGDRRCDPKRAAESAFLVVEPGHDGEPRTDLRIDTTWPGEAAVTTLRDRYDAQQAASCQAHGLTSTWVLFAALLPFTRRRRGAVHAAGVTSSSTVRPFWRAPMPLCGRP